MKLQALAYGAGTGIVVVLSMANAAEPIPTTATPAVIVSTSTEPMAAGSFQPTWDSLKQYEAPEWFRDAKFGIWAHWGPQCEPERGDWYARHMYSQRQRQYNDHLARYGHPSTNGFKDVIHEWRAENWDPDELIALYKRAGARYFIALANHHDNFDNYDSKYQPWNSVNLGPKRDLIGGWADAARKHGLRFGVSVHAAHAFTWYETSQGADTEGPLAGVPYDGRLTKADDKGAWWEGYDPQDLYEQRHSPAEDFEDLGRIHSRWNWGNGASLPDQAYCEKFYNRTVDLINNYQPDLIYFDDTALPLWPVSDAGLKIAAHYYNSSIKWHDGQNEAVIFGKILSPEQRECIVWDVERGFSNQIEPLPWQTCTCIGSWHYDLGVFEKHRYKSAGRVIRTLIDVVSKNGNLLLSVPVRGDGTIDSDEVTVVEGIAEWMEINQEAIHATRPWKVFGEGPQIATAAPLSAQGFNEGKGKPFTAADIRYTQTKDGKALYAFVMGWPTNAAEFRSLGRTQLLGSSIDSVALLGSQEQIEWSQSTDALVVTAPQDQPCDHAVVFKITPAS